jgi:hypothetical protein
MPCAGSPAVRRLLPTIPTEISVVGTVGIRADLERLVAWLRDIEDCGKAAGI